MAQTYDTYSAVRRLVEAGVPEPQAVAMINEQFRFVENIATKDDLHQVQQATQQQILALQQAVAAEFAKVRAEQIAMEARIVKAMTTLVVGVTGAGVGILSVLMTLLKIF